MSHHFRTGLRQLKAATVLALLGALGACGGGGGAGEAASPPDTVFLAANAWRGPLPAGAEQVAAEGFRERVARGELVITGGDESARAEVQARAQLDSARAYLRGRSDLDDATLALLARDAAGNEAAAVTVDQQTRSLNDLATRILQAEQIHKRARDPAEAWAAYAAVHAVAPAALRAGLPAPETLRGASLATLAQAQRQLDAALSADPMLDGTRLEPAVSAMAGRARALVAGDGNDNSGACTSDSYLHRFWFPLKGFLPPVKDQARRGTCWAFSAVAAVEIRERVQNDNPVDLSEQFLVNQAKAIYNSSDLIEGGSAAPEHTGTTTGLT